MLDRVYVPYRGQKYKGTHTETEYQILLLSEYHKLGINTIILPTKMNGNLGTSYLNSESLTDMSKGASNCQKNHEKTNKNNDIN